MARIFEQGCFLDAKDSMHTSTAGLIALTKPGLSIPSKRELASGVAL